MKCTLPKSVVVWCHYLCALPKTVVDSIFPPNRSSKLGEGKTIFYKNQHTVHFAGTVNFTRCCKTVNFAGFSNACTDEFYCVVTIKTIIKVFSSGLNVFSFMKLLPYADDTDFYLKDERYLKWSNDPCIIKVIMCKDLLLQILDSAMQSQEVQLSECVDGRTLGRDGVAAAAPFCFPEPGTTNAASSCSDSVKTNAPCTFSYTSPKLSH